MRAMLDCTRILKRSMPALILAVLACSPNPEPRVEAAQPSPVEPASMTIDWFDGSVSEAFARAKESDTPIFLYWGAVWCPPCNVIKSSVFTRPDFIQQTRAFIPVYLDGDSERAQQWGEHFAAMGYPTLIVFNPQGEELTRLSSGMAPQHYSEVLALSLRSPRAVRQIKDQALQHPETLSVEDWQQLAWYSWPADQGQILAPDQQPAVFARFARLCPHAPLAQRFALLSWLARITPPAALTAAQQSELAGLLDALLRESAAWQANLDELQYHGVALIQAAGDIHEQEQQARLQRYSQIMHASWNNSALSLKQRMNSLYGLADVAALQAPAQAAELRQALLDRVDWLRQQPLSPQQRQSMLPGAAQMLHELGLSDEARAIFRQEMQQSVAPYYYMAYLAALEQDLGHKEAALDWSRQAWQQAQGPATRTQWGSAHLRRLLTLAPDQEAEIGRLVAAMFTTLGEHPGAFYQRSRVRLQRLLPTMQNWLADSARAQALDAAREPIRSACQALQNDSASAALCQSWLQLTASAS